MNEEPIAGMIIMLICCWGCAALFLGIGMYATRLKTPMHFWSGSRIDPASVSYIPAYNRENGRMWKWYSVPYWSAGAFTLFGGGSDPAAICAMVLLILAFIPGMPILIASYNRISNRYITATQNPPKET